MRYQVRYQVSYQVRYQVRYEVRCLGQESSGQSQKSSINPLLKPHAFFWGGELFGFSVCVCVCFFFPIRFSKS